jgi:hypothetical protein
MISADFILKFAIIGIAVLKKMNAEKPANQNGWLEY